MTLKGPTQDGGGIPQGVTQMYVLCPTVLIILTEDWQRVGFFGGEGRIVVRRRKSKRQACRERWKMEV